MALLPSPLFRVKGLQQAIKSVSVAGRCEPIARCLAVFVVYVSFGRFITFELRRQSKNAFNS